MTALSILIVGSVNVTNLQLYGLLQGKANVDKLFVSKTAKLFGDANHNQIAIEPGAYIDGHCVRSGAPIPAEQSKPDLIIADSREKPSQKHK